MRGVRAVFSRALGLSIMLTACSQDSGRKVLDNYLYRLGNVLNQDYILPDPKLERLAALPTQNKPPEANSLNRNKSPDQDASIGVLDFLSLYGCDLQVVVAEKNSGLGKFAQSSQRLISEIRFLQEAPACLASLRESENEELATKLEQVAASKRETLGNMFWQAVLGDNEAKSFWFDPEDLAAYPSQTGKELVLALSQLEQWAKNINQSGPYLADLTLSSAELEDALFELDKGDGGRLYRALMRYQAYLGSANVMLEQAQQVDCRSVNKSERKQRLETVVQKFFVGEVQQWASALSQRYYELMPVLQGLETTLFQYESKDYRQWRTQRDQAMEAALKSSQTHVVLLQAVLDGC